VNAADLQSLVEQTTPAPFDWNVDRTTLARQAVRLAQRILELRQEALRLARPLPHTEAFFSSKKQVRLLFGSNQCTSLDTPIPTNRGLLPAAHVKVGDAVIGGQVIAKWISPEPVTTFRVTCTGGYSVVANREHPLLTKEGFKTVADIRPGDEIKVALDDWPWDDSPVMTATDAYFCGIMVGDGCLTQPHGVMRLTTADAFLAEWFTTYLSSQHVQVDQKAGNKAVDLRVCIASLKEKMEYLWGVQMVGAREKSIPSAVFGARELARQFLRGYTDTDGCVYMPKKSVKGRRIVWISASELLLTQVQQLLLAFGVFSELTHTAKTLGDKQFDQWRLTAHGPWADRFVERIGCALVRKQDKWKAKTGVQKRKCKPCPDEKWVTVKWRHHCHKKYVVGLTVDPTNTYVTAGLWSHNSAKTFHGLLELARAVTGQDPYNKYPKKNGRAIIVGYDGDHLADPVYHKLFNPGEFKLIPDEQTGQLRAVRPNPNNPRQIDLYDDSYREKWVDAPPLIPPRFVAEQAWDRPNKRIPRLTTLTTGWTILWRSSNGRPPRGRQLHLVYLDEDLKHTDAWVNELIPRLIRHGGKMIWAATHQEGGPELYELTEKANAGSIYIDAFQLRIVDNPFISEEQRDFFLNTLTTEQDVMVRYYGESAVVGRKIYRDYSPNGSHGCEPFPFPMTTWCRYLFIDPGAVRSAALIIGVDPKERHRWVIDGVDIRQGDATRLAAEIKARQGGAHFEAIIIDQQAGKQTPMGHEARDRTAPYYWRALESAGVVPRVQGPIAGFFPSCNDVHAREEALKGWMQIRGTGPFAGTPILQVVRGALPELDRQISLAQYITPERRLKQPQDLLDCLEYAAAFNPTFHPPEPIRIRTPPPCRSVADRFHAKRQHDHARRQSRRFGAAMEVG